MTNFTQIEDKTLYKAIDDDRLKVEIGGSTDYFAPSVNMSYKLESGSEKYFVNICDDESQMLTDKVTEIVDKDLISVRVGDVESTFKNDTDRLKIERVFYKKPTEAPKYKLLFSSGVSFYYQNELTAEDIVDGASRPDNVVGSYAIYCEQSGCYKTKDGKTLVNYGCGKIGHLYAPYWTDAKGNKVKGTQEIQDGVLTFALPDQKWLDAATLPIKLDPDIGYTTAGASEANFNSGNRYGVKYPTASDESGDLDSMSIAWKHTNATYGRYVELGLYEGTTPGSAPDAGEIRSSLTGTEYDSKVDETNDFMELDFSGENFSISVSTDYWLTAQFVNTADGAPSDTRYYYDSTPTKTWRYNVFSVPWVGLGNASSLTYNVSIYFTYTAAGDSTLLPIKFNQVRKIISTGIYRKHVYTIPSIRFGLFEEASSGTIINLLANLTNTSSTTDIDILISRYLISSLINISNTGNIDHEMLRKLNVLLTNVSETSDITVSLASIISYLASISNTSTTSTIDKTIVRDIVATLSNISTTTTIDQNIIRTLIASVANVSTTTDITADFIINFVASLNNISTITDIEKTIIRNLLTSISNISTITAIDQNLTRDLLASISNISTTLSIDHVFTRNLLSNLVNSSTTTTVDKIILRELLAVLANASTTTDITVSLAAIISFVANLSNTSVTSDIDKVFLRNILANLTNNSTTTDIEQVILREIVASFSNISSTDDINKTILIKLAATIANTSVTSDIEIILSNLISFACSIANTSTTTSIDKQILRNLSTAIANISTTTAIEFIKTISLSVDLSNLSNTSDITKIMERFFKANLSNQSLTSDDVTIILGILAISASSILSISMKQNLLELLIEQNELSVETKTDTLTMIARSDNLNITIN